MGTDSLERVDFPVYAAKVAQAVSDGELDMGVLVCGTGLGMALAASRFPGVRAVSVSESFSARMARRHNDANILCLGARVLGAGAAVEVLQAWLAEDFEGGRYAERLEMMRGGYKTERQAIGDVRTTEARVASYADLSLEQVDPVIGGTDQTGARSPAAQHRADRLRELHPAAPCCRRWGACSPTSTPRATPAARYYGGCEVVDEVEALAIERAKALFGAEHANVQPHSGSTANQAVYCGRSRAGRHASWP